MGPFLGGLYGLPSSTTNTVESLARALERILDEPVDIHHLPQQAGLEILAQQSQVRYHLNEQAMGQDQEALARQVGLGLQQAIAQSQGNLALAQMAQMAQQQMNAANYAQALKDYHGERVFRNQPGTIIPYRNSPPIWTPPPLSRRCSYCWSVIEPVKDCPHCGAPA